MHLNIIRHVRAYLQSTRMTLLPFHCKRIKCTYSPRESTTLVLALVNTTYTVGYTYAFHRNGITRERTCTL